MPSNQESQLLRVAVFYDGNYFTHVSNYYNYEHERRSRLSVSGLHDFVRRQVAEYEKTDPKYCQVVEAHYFRGRLSSYEVQEQNRLFAERVFDDILMSESVVTHYLPVRVKDGRIEEKGIDLYLAMEAYDLAIHKRFDVVVLVACDGDFVPLVRKISSLGTRVMVLGWDFEYTDDRTSRIRKTVTSVDLLRECTYPISMHEVIDNKVSRNESMVNNLFVVRDKKYVPQVKPSNDNDEVYTSTVLTLKNGYGFISWPPNNLYFHYTWLLEGDFNDLDEDDLVEFKIGQNDKGQDVAIEVRKIAGS
jgi:uncharacterized LabA/DUF88 family protein/cold shock CspA family protein